MIDLHAHYLPPRLIEEVKLHSRSLGVALTQQGNVLIFPSAPSRPISQALMDIHGRLEWNEKEGIRLQILSPWMDALGDDLTPSREITWIRLMNDLTALDIEQHSEVGAFAALPTCSAGESAAELRRAVDDLGFSGGVLPTVVGDLDLDVAGLDPLFDAAVGLDVPLFIHPFRVMAPDRMNDRFLWNICGNPFETTLTAVRLFLSATFARWPGLRLLLSHCGGTLPFIAGRVAQAAQTSNRIDVPCDSPDDILNAFYYDTVVHDPAALGFAIRRIGPSRVALGTDVPFPMLIRDVHAHLDRALQWADDADHERSLICDVSPNCVLYGTSSTAAKSETV